MQLTKENNSILKNNFFTLSVFILVAFLLLFITIFINFKYDFGKKSNGAFFYFYNEAKVFFQDKTYYENQYSSKYLEEKDGNGIKPLFSPILYYIFYPLTFLPLNISFIIYIVIIFFIYIFSINLVISYFKRLHDFRFTVLLVFLLFPPFIYTILSANTAIFWIAILNISFYLAKKDKMFLSGIVLSLFLGKPGFFLLIFMMLFLSFKGRLFLGLIVGAISLIVVTSFFNTPSWGDWFKVAFISLNKILYEDIMVFIKQNSGKAYFYPMNAKNNLLLTMQYIITLFGMSSIIAPIIYSFNHSKDFSRNSYWFIFTITFVLASPYLYNYELIILALPMLILLNLLLADRVSPKVIISILIIFFFIIFVIYMLSYVIYVQFLSLILWFFLVNAVIGKRIKNYMPKSFIEYWK